MVIDATIIYRVLSHHIAFNAVYYFYEHPALNRLADAS